MPVHFQGISFDQLQVRESFSETCCQFSVFLDRDNPSRPLQELARQRTLAGANLEDGVVLGGTNGVSDPTQDPRVGQKVLTEAALWR